MTESVKVTQAADEAAREAWPSGYITEREAFKDGFLAGARYQLRREAVLEEGNKRGLYDTTKIGPELVAFLDDRGGMLAALRDEMSEGYRDWLDDAVEALQIARDHLAALTTPAPAVSTDEIVAAEFASAAQKLEVPEGHPDKPQRDFAIGVLWALQEAIHTRALLSKHSPDAPGDERHG